MRTTVDQVSEQQLVPRHVAIIMDGNGRWARGRGLPRLEGHKAGATAVRRAVDACLERGVKYLTLFSFSTENWQRSKEEVSGLMSLLEEALTEHLDDLLSKNIRLRVIGDVSRLPKAVQKVMFRNLEKTENCDSLELILAVSYGAREEMVYAARRMAKRVAAGEIKPNDIDEELFSQSLWTAGIPDPDLLIRTSGEMRISNFLLWQLAYSEIAVIPEFWPDFDGAVLDRCIAEFNQRERRFGLTSEQLAANGTLLGT